MVEAAILVVFPFCMIYTIVSDTLSMTIANRVSLLLVVSFCVLAPLTGMSWSDFGSHFLMAGAVLTVAIGLFSIGQMGGGDGKLIAATSLWFGYSLAFLDYFYITSIIGAALTLGILVLKASPFAIYGSNIGFINRILDPKEKIPYGIALGTGGLLCFNKTPLMIWAMAQMTAI